MANTHTFSRGEEIANSISHGIAALLSIAALVILITISAFHGNVWHIVSFMVFGTTMLLLYICSTLVHALPAGKAKNIFEILDHSVSGEDFRYHHAVWHIFVIAGSTAHFFAVLWYLISGYLGTSMMLISLNNYFTMHLNKWMLF